jgi:type I restriction enzyme S subunit
LFAYADRLETRYVAARAQVDRLTPALLAKAFRGELVPQDPDDEPASVLLERIRAARAAVPPKARSRKDTGRPTKTQKAEILMPNRRDIPDAHLAPSSESVARSPPKRCGPPRSSTSTTSTTRSRTRKRAVC